MPAAVAGQSGQPGYLAAGDEQGGITTDRIAGVSSGHPAIRPSGAGIAVDLLVDLLTVSRQIMA